MNDDSAPTHKRRKLVTAYKTVLSQKQTAFTDEDGERPTPKKKKKKDKKIEYKTVHRYKNINPAK